MTVSDQLLQFWVRVSESLSVRAPLFVAKASYLHIGGSQPHIFHCQQRSVNKALHQIRSSLGRSKMYSRFT